MKTLIKNGTLVTAAESFKADLLMEDGKIALIGASLPADGAQVVDGTGKYVLPGAIDVHTHLELPFGGTVSTDDFYSGHKAAANNALAMQTITFWPTMLVRIADRRSWVSM